MIVDTITKLPVYRFAQIMGIHPLHFCQVSLQTSRSICNATWNRYDWQQADRVGREQVAQCIARAEADIERYLTYRLLPTWEYSELVNVQMPYRAGWHNQQLQANWRKFISGGIRAKTVIQAAAPIVYTDADSDTYKETATVTIPTGAYTANEIRVYYAGHDGADKYEIRPITVVQSGGNLVITFRREQVVKEVLETSLFPTLLDGVDDGNFETTVDVYRLYNDISTEATFYWSSQFVCSCSPGDTCSSCTLNAQSGCLVPLDFNLSVLQFNAATYDATAGAFSLSSFTQMPIIARLFYVAGMRDYTVANPDTQMSPEWERIVAYYAAALLDREVCDCNGDFVLKWRQDVSFTGGADDVSTFQGTQSDLMNPFGTTRGAIQAWKRVLAEALPLAVPIV